MSPLNAYFLGLLILLLIPVVVVDLRERRIPNMANLAIGGAGLAHGLWQDPRWITLAQMLGQAALVMIVLLATASVMRLVSRQSKVGMGDLKFLMAAALWVGMDGAVIVLLLASLGQLLLALALAPWKGMKLREMRPFGPMLACGLAAVAIEQFWWRAI